MRRLTHLVVLVAFVASCGGHWAFFQCVAWVGMVREYSQVVPLAQAVTMTLSGQYPCAMCKAIADQKSAAQDKFLSLDKYPKKFSPPLAMEFVPPAASPASYPSREAAYRFRSDPPPTPPPRSSLS